jgi:hypothetical protein
MREPGAHGAESVTSWIPPTGYCLTRGIGSSTGPTRRELDKHDYLRMWPNPLL